MKIRGLEFNLFLWLALLLTLGMAAGCNVKERKRKQQPSTLRIHLEVPPDGTNLNGPVPIYRAQPVMINVDHNQVLSEANVEEAKVVDTVGGFAIRLKFDRRGTWILEQCTVDSRSRHFAIFSQFGPELKESRWLAAPIISKRITDGVLIFTPDATREEAEQVVLGLTNLSREVKSHSTW